MPDPTTHRQVLEGREGRVKVRAGQDILRYGQDLFTRLPSLGRFSRGQNLEGLTEGQAAGIDNTDLVIGYSLGGREGGAIGGADLAADGETNHFFGPFLKGSLIGLHELAGSGCSRGGEFPFLIDALEQGRVINIDSRLVNEPETQPAIQL